MLRGVCQPKRSTVLQSPPLIFVVPLVAVSTALVCILVSDAVDTGDAAGGTAGDAGGTAGDAPTPNSSSPSPSSNENETFADPCTSTADSGCKSRGIGHG